MATLAFDGMDDEASMDGWLLTCDALTGACAPAEHLPALGEFQLPAGVPLSVSPGEVALIKVYRPGQGPLTGGNGNAAAIAIYTKQGAYDRYVPATGRQHRFYVRGYDGRSMEWND